MHTVEEQQRLYGKTKKGLLMYQIQVYPFSNVRLKWLPEVFKKKPLEKSPEWDAVLLYHHYFTEVKNFSLS